MVLLQGKSPHSARSKDKRGRGTGYGSYSAAVGYAAILETPWVPPNLALWKTLWNFPSIPKIDIFIWTLLHNSIMTSNNLKRKGWEGPSCYSLCNHAEETAEHLFISCEFTKEVWRIMIGSTTERLPNSVMEIISNWNFLSPFNLSKKSLLKLAWMWTPKFLCWKIWLERNNRIFKEESRLPPQVVVKAWTMMAEALSTKPSIKNSTNLSPDEDRWLRELNLNQQTIEAFNPPQKVNWEIRLDE